jgi:hypothetical protein
MSLMKLSLLLLLCTGLKLLAAFCPVPIVLRPIISISSVHSGDGEPDDTVRVRLWRALADGTERSLAELATTLGETRSDLRFHLTHVEKQAKTLQNKSPEWRERRGFSNNGSSSKIRLTKRIGGGKRKEVFYKIS